MRKLSVFVLSALLAFPLNSFATGEVSAKKPEGASLEKTYQLYRGKCITCHDGVADPDKGGKTRDEWFIVIRMMHDYGLELTEEETSALVDYFFTIRKGVENQAG